MTLPTLGVDLLDRTHPIIAGRALLPGATFSATLHGRSRKAGYRYLRMHDERSVVAVDLHHGYHRIIAVDRITRIRRTPRTEER